MPTKRKIVIKARKYRRAEAHARSFEVAKRRVARKRQKSKVGSSGGVVFIIAVSMFLIFTSALFVAVKLTEDKNVAEVDPNERYWDAKTKQVHKVLRNLNATLKAANPEYEGDGEFQVKEGKLVKAQLVNTGIYELSPLMGRPLFTLNCNNNNISDLAPLTGMPLDLLMCAQNKITDLSPLHGMSIRRLAISANDVNDLSPLRDLPLVFLACAKTRVSDLSPLKNMKLQRFDCSSTPARSLAPLAGMPLQLLAIHGTEVTDLTPLAGMQLKTLSFTPKNITRGIDVLRNMTSLIEIGTSASYLLRPKDFWEEYDYGDFGNTPLKKRPEKKPLVKPKRKKKIKK